MEAEIERSEAAASHHQKFFGHAKGNLWRSAQLGQPPRGGDSRHGARIQGFKPYSIFAFPGNWLEAAS